MEWLWFSEIVSLRNNLSIALLVTLDNPFESPWELKM